MGNESMDVGSGKEITLKVDARGRVTLELQPPVRRQFRAVFPDARVFLVSLERLYGLAGCFRCFAWQLSRGTGLSVVYPHADADETRPVHQGVEAVGLEAATGMQHEPALPNRVTPGARSDSHSRIGSREPADLPRGYGAPRQTPASPPVRCSRRRSSARAPERSVHRPRMRR